MGAIARRPSFRELAERLGPEEQDRFVRSLTAEEARAADLDWPGWAHEGQFEPEGGWSTWVILGGRGFGKTKAGAEWVAGLARGGGDSHLGQSLVTVPIRIALVGATLDEVRRVMVEGPSGLLEVAHDQITDWSPSLRRLRFASGAEATLFSGASPESLRGPEHDFAWCDELAKWRHGQGAWDMLQLGLRRGERPRALVTTTPRPGPVLRGIMAERSCVITGGPSWANPHVPPERMAQMRARYAGTRLERQELNGELLTDNPGALWTEELLERCRLLPPLPGREGPGVGPPQAAETPSQRSLAPLAYPPPPPPFQGGEFLRLIIAIDPPTGAGTCGIIACAKDSGGRAHLLADHSVAEQSPEAWSRVVADSAAVWTALHPDAPLLVVAESNQGGLMVTSVLRISNPALNIKLVPAIQGKTDRAAPVALLFEAGRVVVHGRFPELEAQLCGMIAGGDYEGPGKSPDRADAMVWGLTELMLQEARPEPRIRRL